MENREMQEKVHTVTLSHRVAYPKIEALQQQGRERV